MSIPRELGATSRRGWPLTDRSAQHVCTYWVDGDVCTCALFLDLFHFPCFLQVLRFYAYFQEAVHEQRQEQYRIRKCTILYYLEDDTVQVNEPRVENAGIPQGQRHVRLVQPADSLTHSYAHTQVH